MLEDLILICLTLWVLVPTGFMAIIITYIMTQAFAEVIKITWNAVWRR